MSLLFVIREQTWIYRVVILNIWQINIVEELYVQMIVLRVDGQVVNMFFFYEFSEWNEWNIRGVVSLSKEVAIENLGERKMEHVIVFLVTGGQ